jgi:hypothetical protein
VGQKPRVWPMKLSRSAGSLMVSSFIVLFLCPCVFPVVVGLWAVLIGDLCAGVRGWSATWGTGTGAESSRGGKRHRSAQEVSGSVPARERPGCTEDPASDDRNIRMTNSGFASGHS